MHPLRVVAAAAALVLSSPLPASAQGFVQQGPKLLGWPTPGPLFFGFSAAVSADGNTAIVGEMLDDAGLGGAWIYTRANGVWRKQGPKLVGTGGANGHQGYSVAISGDGNTVAIGGPRDANLLGAVWIFVRSGGTWTQQGPKLVGDGSNGAEMQGTSVALSADGNTALFGGCRCDPDDSAQGWAYVFTRSAGVWTQQGPELASGRPFTPFGGLFGVAAALSDDGNTAVIGEPGDHAAWIFTRSGSTWTRNEPRLVASDTNNNFGESVTISGDGLTIAVGGGAVWTFVRSAGTWSPFGSTIVSAGNIRGTDVSLSGDGSVLLEGGQGPGGGDAAYAYSRTASGWTALGDPLIGTGSSSSVLFEVDAVALSSDGLTAIIGDAHLNVGAAWAFTRVQPALPPHATADFDGDHKADMPVIKNTGDWFTLTSASNYENAQGVSVGVARTVPVRGDFDGDGRQDPGFFNPATANWHITLSSHNFASAFDIDMTWGIAGDTPVPGDYDGDGVTDIAIYRTGTALWSIFSSRTATEMVVTYGGPAFTPVGGHDFDGDFVSDIAVYTRATGLWWILTSLSGFTAEFGVSSGGPGYSLVAGDYDGDGKADPGIYRPATGLWYIRTSSTGFASTIAVSWGGPGFIPVPGDYDGDGRFDLGLYQPLSGVWSVLTSTSSYTSAFAVTSSSNEIPLSSAITPPETDLVGDGDIDSDWISEITVFNTSSAQWSTLSSGSGYGTVMNRSWGGSGRLPFTGDFDGDGKFDFGAYLESNGEWLVLLSGANYTSFVVKNVGGTGWTPAPGDYDGDGKTDFVVHNATTGQWFGLKSSTSYTTSISIFYGGAGYTPISADFDGDGTTDIGVYQTATGLWSILLSSTNYTTSLSRYVGGTGWAPVPADHDADGKTDFVVYNANTGQWYGLKSSTSYTTTINMFWGGAGYAPVKGDFDGDNRADLATYVQSTGIWYILLSGANYTTAMARTLGGSSSIPMPAYP